VFLQAKLALWTPLALHSSLKQLNWLGIVFRRISTPNGIWMRCFTSASQLSGVLRIWKMNRNWMAWSRGLGCHSLSLLRWSPVVQLLASWPGWLSSTNSLPLRMVSNTWFGCGVLYWPFCCSGSFCEVLWLYEKAYSCIPVSVSLVLHCLHISSTATSALSVPTTTSVRLDYYTYLIVWFVCFNTHLALVVSSSLYPVYRLIPVCVGNPIVVQGM